MNAQLYQHIRWHCTSQACGTLYDAGPGHEKLDGHLYADGGMQFDDDSGLGERLVAAHEGPHREVEQAQGVSDFVSVAEVLEQVG